MSLNLLPVIVSPTTTRAGYKTRNVVKATNEFIAGDAFYVGKYNIPSVDLSKCQEKLDFACLLAIGTTPINIQSKQLDGLDKTSNLRFVRPTGVASYSILPGVITREEIELITNFAPAAVLPNTVFVFANGLSSSEINEGTEGVSVKINGLPNITEIEGNVSTVLVTVNSKITDNEEEGTTGISVKINGTLVSSQNEGN